MAFSVVGAGTVEYPTGSEQAAFTLPLPAGLVPGDILILNATTNIDSVTAITAPSGAVVLVPMGGTASAGVSGGVWWWEVPASPPASITFTWTVARRGTLAWVALRGDGDLVLDDVEPGSWGTSSANTHTAPALTTTAAGCFVLGGVMVGSGSDTPGVAAGWTPRTDAAQREGFIATKGVQAAAGSSGAAAFTTSAGYRGRAWQIAVREVGAPAVPVLEELVQGIPTQAAQTCTVRAQTATSVRLRHGRDAAMTDAVTGAAVAPDAAGWCSPVSGALAADTAYWVQVELTNAAGTTRSEPFGPMRTAPVPGTPASFEILFGGDLQDDQANATAFDNMAAHAGARFLLSTGDTHNGDNTSSSQASHRGDWENILALNAGLRAQLRSRPFAQSFGDHDQGGGNNSVPGVWTAPNIAAYAQVLPYPPSPMLPVNTSWSFVWGRVRFISPDWGHQRTATSKLSAAAKTWLESELAQPEPLKVLLVGSVWYDAEPPEGWPDGDGWTDYADLRAEIVEMIDASPGDVLGVHGDQHALAAMSGAGNPFGHFPVVGGSPFSGWSSHKGDVDPDSGRWPTLPSEAIVQQYGRLVFEDTGAHIVVTFTGYDETNTARVSLRFGTAGYVEPEPITGASTAGLTAPVDRWVKNPLTPVWHDGARWRAILPTATGHRLYTLDPDGDVQGAVVDNRQGARVTVAHTGGTTYVLRAHATATRLSVFDAAWAPVLTDVSLPLTPPDNDASPIALTRTANGHLWAAAAYGGLVRVTRSSDGGATWSAVTTWSVLTGGQSGVVLLQPTGTTLVLIAMGNDGAGRAVRTITQGAASIAAGSWTSEALPALAGGLTSDDHASALTLPDGRLLVLSKTTGSTASAQQLLYTLVRSTGGAWSMTGFEPGPDNDPGWTRPRLTVADGVVHAVYADWGGPTDLVRRTSPLDALGTWSERTVLMPGPSWMDSAVLPTAEAIAAAAGGPWPILAHDVATHTVWALWQRLGGGGGGGDVTAFLGSAAVTAMYVGAVPVTAAYLGAVRLA